MLPQGPAWQSLRQQALMVVPERTVVLKTRPTTVREWLSTGAFVTAATSRREFLLSASHVEIAAALHSEVAFYLDHAAEHSVTLRNQLGSGRWFSTGWVCVTFYYWAFFLALSLTRMLGRTAVFLEKPQVQSLHTLSAMASPSPGAGAFVMECSPSNTLAYADVKLTKSSQTRVHNLVWQLVAEEIAKLAKLTISGDDEDRLYLALLTAFDFLGSAWPSDLRNAVNYRPGEGYSAGRVAGKIKAFAAVKVDPPTSFDASLGRLEDAISSISKSSTVVDDLNLSSKILLETTIVLDALCHTLHSEVIARRRLDIRWQNARSTFLNRQFSLYNEPKWPFA
ncbi:MULTISPECIES: hypothetical protein [Bradyrhizobium]|uniref:hypothetical protein n=1 Tax=Bradyrhizobium TaxID=374 RepID=UPI000F52082F|nr:MULTISPECIES: hypothetical protein [Bradyrhizobium]RQH05869.1 hypothetical protein EHH60_31405 [Bradyrhizobium sp. RP6]UWU93452.1 hypothetical protein N2604_05710 [Bradyrhizobium sp. CB1015]